jgi:hypothetical protein
LQTPARDFWADVKQVLDATDRIFPPQPNSYPRQNVKKLQEAGIKSYADAYQLLADETAIPDLRIRTVRLLFTLAGFGKMLLHTEFIDNDEIFPAVLVASYGADPDLRHWTITLIEYLDLRVCVPRLLEMVEKDRSPYVKYFAMGLLGKWNEASAVPVMIELAANRKKSKRVRIRALEALNWWFQADERVKPTLRHISLDPYSPLEVREVAARLLMGEEDKNDGE